MLKKVGFKIGALVQMGIITFNEMNVIYREQDNH